MNWRKVWLFVFCFGLPAVTVLGENQNVLPIFQKANAAYREGRYQESASLYESLISKEWKHASVFYNLGNAYFKQDRLGLAILHYEKAKRLNPRNREVLANLDYVRGLLEYRIEDKRNWYLKAGERLLRSYTHAELGITSLALAFLFLASWAVSLYFGEGGLWGWKRKTLLVVTLLCLALWGLKGSYENRIQDAIVLKAQSPIRYGPSYKDRIAFRLSEGMNVQVNKREGDWSRVALMNGETGWMAQEDLGVV
jgi:tetratricopeptide (TPR) repeat protein